MAGEVLSMKLIAKFGQWCFLSTVVQKSRHYAKPQTVFVLNCSEEIQSECFTNDGRHFIK